MSAEDTSSIQPIPIYAWSEEQTHTSTFPGLPEDEDTFLFEKVPSVEDIPSLPSAGTRVSSASILSSEQENSALEYVRSFIWSNGQDMSEWVKFLDELNILHSSSSTTTTTTVHSLHISSLAVKVIKFLITWTASINVKERERAIEQIIQLCKRMLTGPAFKEKADFPVAGQLVGCFILCCSDCSEVVARCASEGLHHLHSFLLHKASQPMAKRDAPILPLLMAWEREENLFASPMETPSFTDPMEITMEFRKYLSPAELTDVMVAAISGMRDDSAHNTTTAISMLRAIQRDQSLALGKLSKAVDCIHHNLASISNSLARQETRKTLCFLGKDGMIHVVRALLLCSPECDSTAAEMWMTLVCFSGLASKVLRSLLSCLQSKLPMQDLSGENVVLLPAAATRALDVILACSPPAFKKELKNMWEKLCLALIFWIAHTFDPKVCEWESEMQETSRHPSPRLARAAVSTLRTLLRHAGCENQGLLMKKFTVWDLLVNAETHHQGVALFARALVRNPPRELKWMVGHVLAVLSDPDEGRHASAMAFLVEFLQCPELGNDKDKDILKHLGQHLMSSKATFRSLALEGMLHLTATPERAEPLMLKPLLLEEIPKRLQESDREISLKTLRLVKQMTSCLAGSREAGAFAVGVAGPVLPLFDDESHKVRFLAIGLFSNLLEMATSWQARKQMKTHALHSLVPLVMHLHDQSPHVIQVSWDTLSSVGRFLGCRKLQPLIRSQDKWSICLLIIKKYRTVTACHFLAQSIKYLKSPQAAIRELAVRLIGLGAQETKNKRNLETICKALSNLQDDPKPSVSCLAIQTIRILEVVHDQIPDGFSFRIMLHRIWRSCF
ncbi:maestro heat-like repeat family member 5 [Hemicordylus capensis]|uniref:maestro heat-like repeat family member 5 n=1 Tax=Hemicordylus capensis TaxID=884348 RepID=UPI0023024B55|nr:maestro heat-like repeat family member 5 [Hemicordylus capensis]